MPAGAHGPMARLGRVIGAYAEADQRQRIAWTWLKVLAASRMRRLISRTSSKLRVRKVTPM